MITFLTIGANMDVIANVLIGLLTVIPAFVASLFVSARLAKKMPNHKPYRWGSFLGCQAIALGLVGFGGSVVGVMSNDLYLDEALGLTIVSTFYFLIGFFVIRKYRWAVISVVVLSFNPAIWVTWGYFSNRSDELVRVSQSRRPFRSIANGLRQARLKSRLPGVTVAMGNVAFFVLAYGIIRLIGREFFGRRFEPIGDFGDAWFGWFVYLAIATVINYILLPERSNHRESHWSHDNDALATSQKPAPNETEEIEAMSSSDRLNDKQGSGSDIAQAANKKPNWCARCKRATPATRDGNCAVCGTPRLSP